MSQPLPTPPLTELAAAAVQMHELFRAWIAAGFTEPQALQMLCAVLAAGVQRPS